METTNTYEIDKKVNQVFMTYEYDKFKTLSANRELDMSNTLRLEYSMRQRQYPTPIIVNGKYEIIDGQHRYQACKNSGLPVYYMVIEGLDVSDCRILNQNQREWKTTDYLKFFEKLGSRSASRIYELAKRYKISAGTVMWAAGKDRGIVSEIKNAHSKYDWMDDGVFNEGDFEKAKDALDKGQEIAGFLSQSSKINRVNVIKGIVRCAKVDGFNYDRLKKAILEMGSFYGWRASERQVSENLCRLYNKGQRKGFMDVIASQTSYRVYCDAEHNRWK